MSVTTAPPAVRWIAGTPLQPRGKKISKWKRSLENADLRVVIHSGSNLVKKDFFGKSDPYVLVFLFGQLYKSETKKKTLDPQWEDPVLMEPYDLEHDIINFQVWNYDRFMRDDFMGQASCRLSTIANSVKNLGEKVTMNLDLTRRQNDKASVKVSGSLSISFMFIEKILPDGWKKYYHKGLPRYLGPSGQKWRFPPSILHKQEQLLFYDPSEIPPNRKGVIQSVGKPITVKEGSGYLPSLDLWLGDLTSINMPKERRIILRKKDDQEFLLFSGEDGVHTLIGDFTSLTYSCGFKNLPFRLEVPKEYIAKKEPAKPNFPRLICFFGKTDMNEAASIESLILQCTHSDGSFVVPQNWASNEKLVSGVFTSLPYSGFPGIRVNGFNISAASQKTLAQSFQWGCFSIVQVSQVGLEPAFGSLFSHSISQRQIYNTLTFLDVSNNPQLGEAGVLGLIQGLASVFCLRHLDISNTGCSPRSLSAFDLLQTYMLHFFSVGRNNLNGDPGIAVARLVWRSHYMRSLDVGETGMDLTESFRVIHEKKIRLKYLNIRGNQLSSHAINFLNGIIADARPPFLESVSLSAHLAPYVIPLFAYAPPTMKVNLELSDSFEAAPVPGPLPQAINSISFCGGDINVPMLYEISQGGTLEKLVIRNAFRLRDNSDVANVLATMVPNLTHLEIPCSGMQGCGMGPALALIMPAIAESKKITYLDIYGNNAGEHAILALISALRKNRSISTLKMDRNGLTENCLTPLFIALKVNKKLAYFEWPEQDFNNIMEYLNKVVSDSQGEVSMARYQIKLACKVHNYGAKQKALEKLREAIRAGKRAQRSMQKIQQQANSAAEFIKRNQEILNSKQAPRIARRKQFMQRKKAKFMNKKNKKGKKLIKKLTKRLRKIEAMDPFVGAQIRECLEIPDQDMALYKSSIALASNEQFRTLYGPLLELIWKYNFKSKADIKLSKLNRKRNMGGPMRRRYPNRRRRRRRQQQKKESDEEPPSSSSSSSSSSDSSESSGSEDDDEGSEDEGEEEDDAGGDEDGGGGSGSGSDFDISDDDDDDDADDGGDDGDAVDDYGGFGPRDLPDGGEDGGKTKVKSKEVRAKIQPVKEREGFFSPKKAKIWCRYWNKRLVEALKHWPIPIPDFDKVFNHLRSKLPRFDSDITVVTQLSLDRLGHLEEMAMNWSGVLTAAIYIPFELTSNKEKLNTEMKRIAILHEATEIEGRCRLDIALVYQLCDDGSQYPINVLRNTAIEQVSSHSGIICVLDVDFIPSEGLHEHLISELAKNPIQPGLKRAIVLPAFETVSKKQIPKTKEEAVSMFSLGSICSFHTRHFPQGHAPTDYIKWKTATEPYFAKYREGYEPYVVVRKDDVPRFDERFTGYGMNKIQWLMHLSFLGWEFKVDPTHFVVSRPHEKSDAWKATYGSPLRTHHYFMIKVLYEKFKEELNEDFKLLHSSKHQTTSSVVSA